MFFAESHEQTMPQARTVLIWSYLENISQKKWKHNTCPNRYRILRWIECLICLKEFKLNKECAWQSIKRMHSSRRRSLIVSATTVIYSFKAYQFKVGGNVSLGWPNYPRVMLESSLSTTHTETIPMTHFHSTVFRFEFVTWVEVKLITLRRLIYSLAYRLACHSSVGDNKTS